MTSAVIQPSFASGEMSPSTYGRVDLAKYHSGVALARNFYVDYRGGLSTRFGTSFVGQCKDSTTPNRLIPFTFSTIQTYALVFGDHSMRVVKDGAYVVEPSTNLFNVSNANPGVFYSPGHDYASGDLLYFSGFPVGSMTQMNQRFGTAVVIDADHYSLIDMFGEPLSTLDYAPFSFLSGTAIAARVFTLATPYAAEDLALLKFSQSADTMTLTHASYPEQQLTRAQHWIWSITPTVFVSTQPIPTNLTAAASESGSTTYRYVVTSLGKNSISESLPSIPVSVTSTTLSNPSPDAGASITVSWDGTPGDTIYNIYRTPESQGQVPADGALYGYVGSTVAATVNSFIDNNILPDFTNTPPQANNPFAIGQIQSVAVDVHGSGYTTAPITVTDATGSGAILLAVITAGAVTAVVVVSGGQNYTAPTFSVAGDGTGAVLGAAVLSTQNYPACSAYYQQRQVRGGLTSAVDKLVFSRTGDFENMSYSTPSRANDEVEVTLTSQTVNPIKHMVPLTSLIVLTGSGAWRVDGGSQSDSITPDHINAVPQAYNGCSDVPPLVINYDILYVQAKGSIVRDLSYNFYVNVYTGEDISMLANHLFFGHQITEWCWAEEPFKIVWAVRDDGILLSLTFLKEQQISGWCRHDTAGLYKSICSISEGAENAVYQIVERTVRGKSLQYIERCASRNIGGDPAIGIPGDVTKAWCVDCGLQYLGAPVMSVSGLDHLNGLTVSILADGSVQPSQVVENGSVPLQFAASAITVGLGYVAQIKTLNLDILGEATIQGKRKKLSAVTARVADTRGLKVSATSFDTLYEMKERTTETMGQAVALKTTDERIIVAPSFNVQGQIYLQQDQPLPATLLALIPEVTIGDS